MGKKEISAMTDQTPGYAEVPGALPEGSADYGTQAAAPDAQAPQFVTKADLESFAAQFARQVQSQMDKRTNTVERRFAEKLSQYEAALSTAREGGQIDEPTAAKLQAFYRQKAMDEAIAGTNQEVQESQQYNAQADTITQQGQYLANLHGLAQGDPEIHMVDPNGTPDDYLASIVRAGQAKAMRLAGYGRQPQAARMPGLAPAGSHQPRNPLANIDDPDELYAMAEAEMQSRLSGRRR